MNEEERAAAASRQHAEHFSRECQDQFNRESLRSDTCMRAFEGIDTKAIETLAAKGGVLDLARKAEKVALHLAAALHENAMLRETIERLKP